MRLILLSLLLLFYTCAFSQKKQINFELTLPTSKISNARYNKIQLLDFRSENATLGILTAGTFNKNKVVVCKTPMYEQLNNVMKFLVDSTADNRQLLLVLRELKFSEFDEQYYEIGNCSIKAMLYGSVKPNQFFHISNLDTILHANSYEVSDILISMGKKVLPDFISNNIQTKIDTSQTHYSYKEVSDIDNIEKQKIPIYNTTQYVDGVYKTFRSFTNLQPDEKDFELTFGKKKLPKKLKIKNADGKFIQEKSIQNVYAVIFNNQPYIFTRYGMFPLKMQSNDFYFVSKLPASKQRKDLLLNVFTLNPFAIAADYWLSEAEAIGSYELYENKIDFMSGDIMKLVQIFD